MLFSIINFFKEIIFIILFLIIFLLISYSLKNFLNINELLKYYFSFEEIIEKNRILASILFVLVFVFWVSSFLPLITIFQIFSGFVFGAVLGTILSISSILIGSIFIYYYPINKISLKFLQKKKINLFLLKSKFTQNEFFYLLLIRVLPGFPFSLQGALASYLKVNISKFIFSTLLGLMPISYLINLFGSQINHSLLYNDTITISFQKDISYYFPLLILFLIYFFKFLLIKLREKFFF